MSTLLFSAVSFDHGSNLYTYDYAVENDSSSTIWNVDILVGNTLLGTYLGLQPLVPSYTAPNGWTMYGAFSGSIANSPYNESGGFYEWYGNGNVIQPWTQATLGFSVVTPFAPTLDSGLNNYFLYGSEGVVGYGNVVVPDGAQWYVPPPYYPPQYVHGVPELATWMMLVIGFVAVGALASLRKDRRMV